MANPTEDKPGAPGHPAGGEAAQPDLVALAQQLATKHDAGGTAAPPGKSGPAGPVDRGGRRPIAEEVSRYLRKNNLVAVPANPAGDSGGPAPGPGADLAPPLPAPEIAPGDPGGHYPAETGYVVTPDFVKTCANTLLGGIEAWRQREVALKVMALSGDKALADSFAKEAGAPPGAIEVMAICAAEISQKYSMLSQWSPEALLIIGAATWYAKDLALMKKLNALAALKRQSQAETKPAA